MGIGWLRREGDARASEVPRETAPDNAPTPERARAPSGAFGRVLAPLLSGALFCAIGEGSATARVTGRPGTFVAVAAGLVAALLVAPLLVLGAGAIAWALSRPILRRSARAMARVLTGGRARFAGILGVLGALSVAATSMLSQRLGEWLTAHVSTGVALGVALAVNDGLLVIAAVVVGCASSDLARGLARLEARAPRLRGRVDAQWTLAVACLLLAVVLAARLPIAFAVAPVSFLFGLAAGVVRFRDGDVTLGRRALAALALGLAALAALGAALLERVPPEAQVAVVARSPYASLAIAAARRVVDADRDGFSPILLGGDCDDRDAAKNPGAADVPENGVDENCSGADARTYVPAVAPSAPRPVTLPPRANVVLVQLDALRPDHVGFAGYRRKTPALDAFRASATWFARAYSPMPSTRFAIAAVFTGKDGAAVPQDYAGGPDYWLFPTAETVAERLGEAGYDRRGLTISYVQQHIHGVEQGFASFETPWPVDDWAATYPRSAQLTTDAALGLLARATAGAPFFHFVHYQCGHDPYAAQPEFPFGDDSVDQYDSAVAYCDRELGRYLRALDARTDRDATAVIVFSDHGELFGEHGLTAHGNSLYEPDVRALILLRLPGGRRVETVGERVSLTDLAPTVLELAGLAPRPDTDPWSLVAYGTPDAPARPARPIFLGADLWRGPVHFLSTGVVDGHFKLVRDRMARSDELFDLDLDPQERVNLAPALPAARGRMLELLESHDARVGVY